MASADPAYTPTVQGASTPEAAEHLQQFWQKVITDIRNMAPHEFKQQELPLARIKKIMKLDEDVKMISTEAPVLFAKATEIFIQELTLRAWLDTEDNKRRTLQRNDIAMAISKFDQFDFLIDIVPRDELKPTKRSEENVQRTSMLPDQVQYYFQLAQQHQAALQQQTQPQQQQQQQPQQIQIQGGQVLQQPIQIQLATTQAGTTTGGGEVIQAQPQIIQIQGAVQQQPQQQQQQSQQPQQQQQQQQQSQPTPQVFQQIVTPGGEIQNVPLQLSAAQYQALQLQMQGKQAGQPIIIQTQAAVQQQDQTQQQQQFSQPLFQVQQLQNQVQYVQQGDGDPQADGQGEPAS